jgi:amino acid transporter
MNKAITIMTLGLQIALTFIATICIYMLFALLDSNFGFDGLFGLAVFQPILAVTLSGLTIFVCLILGLPIRLNNKLHYWWTTNFYIPIIGTAIGLTFLFLALLPTFNETVTYDLDGELTLKQIPNSMLSITGWLLTAFSILHIYPPRQLTERVKDFFQKGF